MVRIRSHDAGLRVRKRNKIKNFSMDVIDKHQETRVCKGPPPNTNLAAMDLRPVDRPRLRADTEQVALTVWEGHRRRADVVQPRERSLAATNGSV